MLLIGEMHVLKPAESVAKLRVPGLTRVFSVQNQAAAASTDGAKPEAAKPEEAAPAGALATDAAQQALPSNRQPVPPGKGKKVKTPKPPKSGGK